MSLQEKVDELAKEHEVPGVSAGILLDGEEHYGFAGVTSVENPLPVDANTLFQFGSTGKTFTATAIMRLVEQERVDLDAPVRRYVPELELKDPSVAEKVTVLQLLNHTAGWEGDLLEDTGNGDDALARYVEKMRGLEQTRPPGTGVSYNNASLSLAGRLIEKVTGSTYEQAMRDLVLAPLGLDNTLFFPNDVMTRRFAVGHNRQQDGSFKIARPWAIPRSSNPAGGMSAPASEQLAWARFHMGDGRAPDGTKLLEEASLRRMQEPTAEIVGSALGDYVAISWFLRDVSDVRLVSHGGTTNGQHSTFVMVPERRFALISMTNAGPNGPQLNRELQVWALEHFLGVLDAEPEPVDRPSERLAAYLGTFETVAVACEITERGGGLEVAISIKPEMAAVLREAGDEPPEDDPPIPLGFLDLDSDNFVVSDGPAKGMRGYFVRSDDGEVSGVHLGGRLASKVAAPA